MYADERLGTLKKSLLQYKQRKTHGHRKHQNGRRLRTFCHLQNILVIILLIGSSYLFIFINSSVGYIYCLFQFSGVYMLHFSISGAEPADRLLHFSAKLGLTQLTNHLLTLPGSQSALSSLNKDHLLPEDLARDNGHHDLAALLQL